MVTSKQCIDIYGLPNIYMERRHMVLWDVPEHINKAIPTIPNKIYCNKDLLKPLEAAFNNIINRGYTDMVKTWDGCFNIRKKRGGTSFSLHSWGIAIDINAAWNGFKQKPQMPNELVFCFVDAGFEWGGHRKKTPDGMHFQLKKL